MSRITVDLSALRQLRRRMEAAAADAVPAALTRRLAAESEAQTQARFGRRVAPSGAQWAPRKRPYPHPPLEKTRRMRRSITAFPDGPEAIGQSAEPPYTRPHQFGAPSRNLPARPFLGWSAGNVESLADTSANWLAGWWGERL